MTALVSLVDGRVGDRALRDAFGCFPTGVTALCALAGTAPVGIAASSFTSVSLEPPLVSVCMGRSSTTWPKLREAPRLGVSVLAAHQDRVGRILAAKGVDRFASVAWHATAGGAVLLRGASAWLECGLHDVVPAGDHDIVLLRVHALAVFPDAAPLVFHGSQFRELKTLDWCA